MPSYNAADLINNMIVFRRHMVVKETYRKGVVDLPCKRCSETEV